MRKDRIKSRDQREEMCEKCEFFCGSLTGQPHGECQRFPPNITPAGEVTIAFLEQRRSYLPGEPESDTSIPIYSEYPVVSEFHWCGEFKQQQQFKLRNLQLFCKQHPPKKPLVREPVKEKRTKPKRLDTRIEDLSLTTRTINCLIEMNLHTLEDLAKKKKCELTSFPSFGRKRLIEVVELLHEYGIKLEAY